MNVLSHRKLGRLMSVADGGVVDGINVAKVPGVVSWSPAFFLDKTRMCDVALCKFSTSIG